MHSPQAVSQAYVLWLAHLLRRHTFLFLAASIEALSLDFFVSRGPSCWLVLAPRNFGGKHWSETYGFA